MLGEIVDLVRLTIDAITQHKAKKVGWVKVYDLYRSLGDIISDSENVIQHLKYAGLVTYVPITSYQEEAINKTFILLDISVEEFVERVQKISRDFRLVNNAFGPIRDVLEIYDHDLFSNISIYLSDKSEWLRAFRTSYSSGKITKDGKFIKRVVINPPGELIARYREYLKSSGVKNSTKTLNDMYRELHMEELMEIVSEIDIDISKNGERAKLVEAGKENIQNLRAVKVQLAEFIRTNCKIEDLLLIDKHH